MSENDVFDEELMKELGLDPTEFKEGQAAPKPKPSQATPPPPGPRAQRGASAGMSDSMNRPRPQRPAPQQTPPSQAAPEQPNPPRPQQTQQPEQDKAQHAERPTQSEPKPVSGESQAKKISNELPIQLAAVMAKKTLRLGDILGMNVGEVIEFKKPHTEPIDLVANGKLVAKAELVVVEGKLGARIIKIVR
ncbi:MAG: FliM/FliN family flagellar motor switch protein [bacterium]|nr:FliM/FliN family flagellar motor switch protein [bacterium]MBU1918592.1 FliM/FliN family flagellar motor switch protein [bacterium]